MKDKRSWLKSFFIGFVVLGTLSSTQLVADTVQVQTKRMDDAAVQVQPDGTKVIQDGDASIQIKPDGTKIIKKLDGTSITIKPDGTKMVQDKDGTMIQIMPDGSKTITKPDGTSIQIKSGQSNAEADKY